MIYGENKIREMLRSVLPSKARKASRDKKRNVNRVRRRSVRHHLHRLEDYDDDIELHYRDKKYKIEMKMVVDDRRDADKISHFVRWAEFITEKKMGIDKEDVASKRAAFISYIGGADDLIRSHAVGHFVFESQLNPYYFNRRYNYVRKHKSSEEMIPKIEKALKKALDRDHSGLNRMLKEVGLRNGHCHKDSPCNSGWLHNNSQCQRRLLVLAGDTDLSPIASAIHFGGNNFSSLRSPDNCKKLIFEYLKID